MNAFKVSRKVILAVYVALIAALVGRSWLQIQLIGDDYPQHVAADLSYLIVPVVLVAVMWPLYRSEHRFVTAQYRVRDLSKNVFLGAVAVGLLLRVAWWAQLIAGVSFGIYTSDNPAAIEGPNFAFRCEPMSHIVLGLVVSAGLIPVVEEVVHRGYTIVFVSPRGPLVATLVSSAIFMIFHRFGTWPTAFAAGLVFAIFYWRTNSLWYSTIAHATFNATSQFDWRCTSIQWNPSSATLPIFVPGVSALAVLFVAGFLIVFCLAKVGSGETRLPGA